MARADWLSARPPSAALRAARTASKRVDVGSSPFRLRLLRSSVCESVDSVIFCNGFGFLLHLPIDTGLS
jgi:hypothetical protein